MINIIDDIYVVQLPELGVYQNVDPETGSAFANEAAALAWSDAYVAAAAEQAAIAVTSAAIAAAAEVTRVSATPRTVAGFDFLRRFAVAERIAVRELAKTDPVAKDFLHMLDSAISSGTPIMTDDADLIAGMAYLKSTPAGTPVLNATRAAEILS